MKQNKFFLLLLLVASVFTFVACGDDEEQKPEVGKYNSEVVGTYQGWTHLTTNFINKNYDGDTFTLSLAKDGTLTAVFTDKTWGTATFTGINSALHKDYFNAMDDNPNVYTFSEAKGTFVMINPRENTTQEFECQLVNPMLSGRYFTATITTHMEVGHGDMTFTFSTGEMPVE